MGEEIMKINKSIDSIKLTVNTGRDHHAAARYAHMGCRAAAAAAKR